MLNDKMSGAFPCFSSFTRTLLARFRAEKVAEADIVVALQSLPMNNDDERLGP